MVPANRAQLDEIPALSTKCGALRWIFIDEVEAVGAELLGQLEHDVRTHVSSDSPFKYSNKKQRDVRFFFRRRQRCILGGYLAVATTWAHSYNVQSLSHQSYRKC